MKACFGFILLCSAFLSFAGDEERVIPPAEFQEKVKTEPGVVLDVRTPEEYNAGHLTGATHINYYDEDFKERIQALDKGETYYVYCKSGGRSGRTLKMMTEAGFTKVFDMKGGITAWNAAGLPTEK